MISSSLSPPIKCTSQCWRPHCMCSQCIADSNHCIARQKPALHVSALGPVARCRARETEKLDFTPAPDADVSKVLSCGEHCVSYKRNLSEIILRCWNVWWKLRVAISLFPCSSSAYCRQVLRGRKKQPLRKQSRFLTFPSQRRKSTSSNSGHKGDLSLRLQIIWQI